jgi:hypothetical protein
VTLVGGSRPPHQHQGNPALCQTNFGEQGQSPAGGPYKDFRANIFLDEWNEAKNLGNPQTILGGGIDSLTTGVDVEKTIDDPLASPYPDPHFLACHQYFIWTKCPGCGAKFAKILNCGREWCHECTDDTRDRRVARCLPKVKKMKSMGYFVIEWPLVSRGKVRSKEYWKWAGNTVKAVLSGDWDIECWRYDEPVDKKTEKWIRKHWFKRGIRRWHWFGDPDKLSEGETPKWNPHLNVFVPGGRLSPNKLEMVTEFLRIALDEDYLIVHYSYTKEPTKMLHLLNYVCRNTFLKADWDYRMAVEIKGFRNMEYWGTWDGPDQWSLSEAKMDYLAKLESGYCPECGAELTDWNAPVPIRALEKAVKSARASPIGAGWYRLADDYGEVKPLEKACPMAYELIYGHEETLEELLDF